MGELREFGEVICPVLPASLSDRLMALYSPPLHHHREKFSSPRGIFALVTGKVKIRYMPYSSTREYRREWRLKNAQNARVSERRARRTPKAKAQRAIHDREYYQRNKERILARKRAAHKRNPLKDRARDKVWYALKHGKLVKMPCEICGNVKSQAHHEDYNKPLDVKWLCAAHHALEMEVNTPV